MTKVENPRPHANHLEINGARLRKHIVETGNILIWKFKRVFKILTTNHVTVAFFNKF